MNTALSAEQVLQFERDGYLLLRGMLPAAHCAALLELTESHLATAVPPLEYEAELGYPGAPQALDAPGGKTVRRLRGAYQRDERLRQWATEPALLTRLQQLFGEQVSVSLAHHNCVMTKHPDYGTATGWHRDMRYWSFARDDLISVWLALGAETATNGALKVIPGSHRMKIAPEQLDALDFLRPERPENQRLFAQGITLELAAGDVLFFHSLLFHAAGRNESAAVKASVVFAYHAQSNAPLAESTSGVIGSIAL